MVVELIPARFGFKRGLGFQLLVEAEELRRFARFAKEHGHDGSVTTDIVLRWVSQDPNYSRWYKARRLETVQTFAKYVVVFDSNAELPPKGIFGKCHGRTTPRIVSESEIVILMAEARNLLSPDGLRAPTIAVALGLLWSTGLRPSELCRLQESDVDLHAGFLDIRQTKFNKHRCIPIHDTTKLALQEYETLRNTLHSCGDGHFFLSTGGRPLTLRSLEYAMTVVRPSIANVDQANAKEPVPRLYDLRHSYACATIKRWLTDGDDVNQKLLTLSTYLGHAKPSDTYWYLTGTPELLTIAGNRFGEYVDSFCGGQNHEE